MIILDPAQRPTVEDLKTDPWFEGMDWDALTYGPTAPRECLQCNTFSTVALIDVPVYRVFHTVLRGSGRRTALVYVGLVGREIQLRNVCGRGEKSEEADGHVRQRATCVRLSPALSR